MILVGGIGAFAYADTIGGNIIALIVTNVSLFWLARVGLGNFITLASSECIFFAGYIIVLLARNEQLILTIFNQGRTMFWGGMNNWSNHDIDEGKN